VLRIFISGLNSLISDTLFSLNPPDLPNNYNRQSNNYRRGYNNNRHNHNNL